MCREAFARAADLYDPVPRLTRPGTLNLGHVGRRVRLPALNHFSERPVHLAGVASLRERTSEDGVVR